MSSIPTTKRPQNSAAKAQEAGSILLDHLNKTAAVIKYLDLFVRVFALLSAGLAVWLLVSVVDHWLFALPRLVRWAVWLGCVSATIWVFIRQIIPLLFGRINPDYAALRIEHVEPEFKNGLISWLQLQSEQSGVPRGIMAALTYRAMRFIGGQEPSSTVDTSPLIKLLAAFLLLTTSLAVYAVASPKSIFRTGQRVLMPWTDLSAPSRVHITSVEPGATIVSAGEPLDVAVQIRGLRSDEAAWLYFSTRDGQLQDESIELELSSAGFEYVGQLKTTKVGVEHELSYWIVAGDARSEQFDVKLAPLPTINLEAVELEFPPYTRLPKQLVSGRKVEAVEGTVASIRAKGNQTLVRGSVEINPELDTNGDFIVAEEVLTAAIEGRMLSAQWTMKLNNRRETPTTVDYRIRGFNARGAGNPQPIIHQLSVLADLPPEIQILGPPNRRIRVRPDSKLTLEVRASDPDYGLNQVQLTIARNGVDVATRTLVEGDGLQGRQSKKQKLDVTALRVQPGDTLEIKATAMDNRHSPVTRKLDANVSQAESLFLDVVGPESADDTAAQNSLADQEEGGQDDRNASGSNTSNSPSANNGNKNQPSESENSTGDSSSDTSSGGSSSGADSEASGAQQKSGNASGGSQESGSQESGGQDSGSQESGGEQSSGRESTGGESSGSGSRSSPKGRERESGAGAESGTSGAQQGTESGAGQPGANGKTPDSERSQTGLESRPPESSGDDVNSKRNSSGGDSSPSRGKPPASDSEVFDRVKQYMEERGESSGSPQSNQPDSGQSATQQSDGQQPGEEQANNQQQSAGQQTGAEQSGSQQSGSQNPGSQQSGSEQLGSQQSGSEPSGANQSGSEQSGGQQSGAKQSGSPQSGSQDSGSQQSGSQQTSGQQSGSQQSGSQQSGSQRSGGQQSGAEQADTQQSSSQEPGSQQSDSQQSGGQQSGSEQSGGKQSGSQQSGSQQPATQQPGSEQSGGQQQSGAEQSGSQQSGAQGTGQQQPGSQQPISQQSGSQQSGSQQPGGQQAGGQTSGAASGSTGSSAPKGDSKMSGGSGDAGAASKGGEAANEEYAQQTGDMVLDYLKRQREQPDPELLQEFDWSKNDLRQFVDRWSEARDLAAQGSEEAQDRWKELLSELGASRGSNRLGPTDLNDTFQQMSDSAIRARPPESLKRKWEAFQRAMKQ